MTDDEARSAEDATPVSPPAVDEAALEDLRDRLRRYRAVSLPPGHGWDRGVDSDFLAGLLVYWLETYDWRRYEAQIRALPWVRTSGGGVPLRGVHQRGGTGDQPAVLLLHGWPDSVLRFTKVLPLLDGVDVVVPALPGFPLAVPLDSPGVRPRAMAAACAALMTELGHPRFVVSAGDVGSEVADWLAADHPDQVAALHLTDVSQNRYRVDPPTDLSTEEQAYVDRGNAWHAVEGGYSHEQATKPHTLAVGLGDSPAGTSAWIIEKLRSWTDCGGDLMSVFSRDELLTWVSVYWFSGAIGTSFTAYADGGRKPSGRLTVPTVFTVFPRDLVNAPRVFAERFYDVRGWREHSSGGHFAAWEEPDAFVAGVRAALALVAL
ncbi:MAG: epoxide hydrolase family protein [Janthinobacterium lividum]